jgi:hypothetical protein
MSIQDTPTRVRVPGTVARVCYKTDHELVSDGYDTWRRERRTPVAAVRAQLVSSKMRHRKGWHVPTLDLDVPHELVPSTTPGHSHLYIDVPMPWWKYKLLLRVLAWTGIIERNYAAVSIRRGLSDVRVPWLRKVSA